MPALLPFIVIALLLLPGMSRGEVSVPDPGTYVVDQAGIIAAGARQRLEGWLRELEQKTTAQVKVLTVPSTQGEDMVSFSQRHAEAWKLGRAGKDNGALIALAVKERKVRIHTGYGLEGALPDSWAGTASRAVAAQFFKRAQYSEGLFQLAVVTANQVADSQRVKLTGIPQYRYRPGRGGGGGGGTLLGSLMFPLLFLFMMLSGMRRRRHYSAWGGRGVGVGGGLLTGMVLGTALGGMTGRGHWGGGMGGGGFGGGFGGSFGGGGGFGGGGAARVGRPPVSGAGSCVPTVG